MCERRELAAKVVDEDEKMCPVEWGPLKPRTEEAKGEPTV